MAGEIPRYFLLRSGSHYIVAQALVAVRQEALPAAVRGAVSEEFEGAATRIEAVELPNPGAPCDGESGGPWAMMASMEQAADGD